jgi:hypothetical protein
MAAALVVFLTDPRLQHYPRPPGDDLRVLAATISRHPADRAALGKIVEQVLDSSPASRFEAWHAAEEQIVRLDPNRPMAAGSFVRSGLFHWYELGEPDRHQVIAAIEPLLRDESFFGRMAQPLFQLTGDFAILRRANPESEGAMTALASMAVTNGRFDDYRLFRDQARKRRLDKFAQMRSGATPAELVNLVPLPPTMADAGLLQGILDALHGKPIGNNKIDTHRSSALIDFALDHELRPLDGLEPIVHIPGAADDPQRARLALHLGQLERAGDIEGASPIADRTQWHRYYVERAVEEMRRHESLAALQYLQKADDGKSPDVVAATEEIQRLAGNAAEATAVHKTLLARANRVEQWLGTCAGDVCNHASGTLWSDGAPFALKFAAVQSDNVPPYAEIYADDALAGEGAVSPSLLARAALLRGVHRIDVRLANPMTRNAIRRRIRIE